MTGLIPMEHRHQPVYRVVRREWADPLDSSFSRLQSGNRWNTRDFPALYCCCSEIVARAVTLDIFRVAGVELSDLRPQVRPQLVEIQWSGRVADVSSPEGVAAAGFPSEYPSGVEPRSTQQVAAEWHAEGWEGVVCRSASLGRLGFRDWTGMHERWGELAIFVENAASPPVLLRRRRDLGWVTLRAQVAGRSDE